MRHLLLYILLLALPLTALAARPDSLAVRPLVTGLGMGAAMTGAGSIGRAARPDAITAADIRRHGDHGAGVAQYAPILLPWAVKSFGVPTRSGWGRMAVSQGLSVAIMAGAVKAAKSGVSSPRPDGSDNRSFPSGHSAWAFMGATAVANELGGTSGWYPFGAYLLATAVQVERVADRHHYPSDVAAGAGIGILSTQLGYLLGDIIMGSRGLDNPPLVDHPEADTPTLEVSTGLDFMLGHIRGLRRLPRLHASLRGGVPVGTHWSVVAEGAFYATPLLTSDGGTYTYINNLNEIGLTLLPTFTLPLGRRACLTADAGAGYRIRLGHPGHDIEAASGTPSGRADVGCLVRLTDTFSARASVGYELSRYKFSTPAHTTSGAAHALMIGVGSVCHF